MKQWLWLVVLVGGGVPVQAKPAPKPNGVVWYRHALDGGGESGDWLALHRERGDVVGLWLRYQVGPDGKPSVECQPFLGETERGAWRVSTCAWDGGVVAWLRYWAFHATLGQRRLELVNSTVSTDATNYTFERTAAPRFPKTQRTLVAAALRLMARRVERQTPR